VSIQPDRQREQSGGRERQQLGGAINTNASCTTRALERKSTISKPRLPLGDYLKAGVESHARRNVKGWVNKAQPRSHAKKKRYAKPGSKRTKKFKKKACSNQKLRFKGKGLPLRATLGEAIGENASRLRRHIRQTKHHTAPRGSRTSGPDTAHNKSNTISAQTILMIHLRQDKFHSAKGAIWKIERILARKDLRSDARMWGVGAGLGLKKQQWQPQLLSMCGGSA